jgi:SAM-dependent methyltransferase
VRARQEDYDGFYREWSKYDDAATSTGSGLSKHDAERLRVIALELARTLPSLDLRVLDAGCATGGLLVALRDAGFARPSGLDPSPRCSEICRVQSFEAYAGTIAAPPPNMPRFDCVVLSHVLEHVFDIPAFFASVRKVLVPNGYLYLETPDASRYVQYLYAPFQEINTEHINHFSPISLENTALRFGLEPVILQQKVLQTSEDQFYPAIFGVFRLLQSSTTARSPRFDQGLRRAIVQYVQESETLMREIDRVLKSPAKTALSCGARGSLR